MNNKLILIVALTLISLSCQTQPTHSSSSIAVDQTYIDEARDIILASQKTSPNEGQWWRRNGSAQKRKPPLPYAKIGATAVHCRALAEIYAQEKSNEKKLQIKHSLEKALLVLLKFGKKNKKKLRANNLQIIWCFIYIPEAIWRMKELNLIEDKYLQKTDNLLKLSLRYLIDLRRPDGTWGYVAQLPGGQSFITASALITLQQARGDNLFKNEIDEIARSLKKNRLANGGFPYFLNKKSSDTRTDTRIGSAYRTPACELALFLAGHSSQENLIKSIEVFFESWPELNRWRNASKERGRPHHGPHQIAPYYYMWSHYYVALAIRHLPSDIQSTYWEKLLPLIQAAYVPGLGWNEMDTANASFSYGCSMAALAFLSNQFCPFNQQER